MVPAVYPGLAPISEQFEQDVRFLISGVHERYGEVSLSNGAYASCEVGSLHAHAGSIDPHDDGAGITYGLVVIADDGHVLIVADKEYPLEPGAVFVINSDDMHETKCIRSDAGLLAFITFDFHHDGYNNPNEPYITVEEFADNTGPTMARYVADGIAKFGKETYLVS